MVLWVRTLLIWLLVLAVPAQGAAAATMAFCGPNHGGGAVAQLQAKTVQAHSHSPAAAQEQTPHGHHAVDPWADDAGDVAAASVEATKSTPANAHKCSACASCCSVGALLNSVPTVAAAEPALIAFSAVVPPVNAFAADGPERPPRAVLA